LRAAPDSARRSRLGECGFELAKLGVASAPTFVVGDLGRRGLDRLGRVTPLAFQLVHSLGGLNVLAVQLGEPADGVVRHPPDRTANRGPSVRRVESGPGARSQLLAPLLAQVGVAVGRERAAASPPFSPFGIVPVRTSDGDRPLEPTELDSRGRASRDRAVCHDSGVARRFVLAVGLSMLLVLGFGAAYVSSGALNGPTLVTICHEPGTPAEDTIIVDDDAVMAHLNHGDYLGPCRTETSATETSATVTLTSVTTTTTVPITETDPPTTLTLPPETATTGITATVPVPPETTTVPETTTIVTVPPASATTVTLPAQTVTQPPVTTTIPGGTTTIPGETVTQPPVTTTTAGGTTTTPGQTVTRPPVTTTIRAEIIERQPETVTLPGATTTVAAAGTTTVVTVTGPNEIVYPGLVIKVPVQAKIKQPRRLVHVARRIHRLRARVRFLVPRVIVVVHRTVIVVGRAGCPPGTKPFKGTCRAAVRGKG
jgi:hypothetical protein